MYLKGEMLDRIETQVEDTAGKVHVSYEEIKEAQKYQGKARKVLRRFRKSQKSILMGPGVKKNIFV
jgi:stalled ribosome rescue protein Dom34